MTKTMAILLAATVLASAGFMASADAGTVVPGHEKQSKNEI